MLGCPHCNHHVWSTDAWLKDVHTNHPRLPMFIEMKLEHVTPAESADVLEALATSQGQPDTSFQKWKVFHLPLFPLAIPWLSTKSEHISLIYSSIFPTRGNSCLFCDLEVKWHIKIILNFVLLLTFIIIMGVGWSQMASLQISLVTSSSLSVNASKPPHIILCWSRVTATNMC